MTSNFRKLLFFLLIFVSGMAAIFTLYSKILPAFSEAPPYTIVLDAGHGE